MVDREDLWAPVLHRPLMSKVDESQCISYFLPGTLF